jgi:uncharacterized membrane protein
MICGATITHMPTTPTELQKTPPKEPFGPVIGICIVLGLLIFGAFYFWGARLNKAGTTTNQVPYIPASTTTLPE